jgi:divalent metal cation (Fe/Co/Zn/Cd) transporter
VSSQAFGVCENLTLTRYLLVRSTSFILLQAVPLGVSPESVRDAILNVDGVRSLHELHIWQLSESRLIASVHVLASPDHDFMHIAKDVRRILHEHGVHSCTIQPEYDCPEEVVDDDVEVNVLTFRLIPMSILTSLVCNRGHRRRRVW